MERAASRLCRLGLDEGRRELPYLAASTMTTAPSPAFPEPGATSPASPSGPRPSATARAIDQADPRVLHFVVLGAQKAGTTSLWRYLASHPELALPLDKSGTFFSHDDRFRRGTTWLFREFFPNAPADARLGTVSPHYMMGTPYASASQSSPSVYGPPSLRYS